MDFNELQSKLEGLSEAQLKLILQLTYGWLPEDKRDLLVKLTGEMKRVNELDKKGE